MMTMATATTVGIVTGLRNPRVSAAGLPGVRVRVGFIQPSPNPYPQRRLAGWPEVKTPLEKQINRLQARQSLLPTFIAAHFDTSETQEKGE